jgi:hypothetical protein
MTNEDRDCAQYAISTAYNKRARGRFDIPWEFKTSDKAQVLSSNTIVLYYPPTRSRKLNNICKNGISSKVYGDTSRRDSIKYVIAKEHQRVRGNGWGWGSKKSVIKKRFCRTTKT